MIDKTQSYFLKNLYKEQSENMIRYAKTILQDRYLAEEAVQETFVVAWEKISSLTEMESPVGWLFGTLKIMMTHIKSEEYKLKKIFISMDESVKNDIAVHDDMESTVLLDSIISSEEFEILEKLYLQGYSYKELADEMGVPTSTIGMRAKRAKEKFKKKYEK